MQRITVSRMQSIESRETLIMTDPLSAAHEIETRAQRNRRRGLSSVFAALLLRWDRNRQRRHLHELDDRLLRDVGLSRDAVARETAKPFWQA